MHRIYLYGVTGRRVARLLSANDPDLALNHFYDSPAECIDIGTRIVAER